MGKQKAEDFVSQLAQPIVDALEIELVDIEYIKEGGSWFLRVFIDKTGGITHADCQAVSERLGEALDGSDPIPHSYILEVSSPGIERPLKKPEDFEKFNGHKIRISTYSPIDGQKEFVGILKDFKDGNLTAEIKGKSMEMPLTAIARVRLEAEF